MSASSSQLQSSLEALSILPSVTGAEPSRAILDAFKLSAATHLSKSLGIELQLAFDGIDTDRAGGDFSVAIPRFGLKKKPAELATLIVDSFKPDQYLKECVQHTTGFVAYKIDSKTLFRLVLTQVTEITRALEANKTAEKNSSLLPYGANTSGAGLKVIIEYSSPNIAKKFHLGHLRSTIIGAFLSELYTFNGWEVVRMNYLGDWGKQFGLLAIGFERFGSEEEFLVNPIKHLFDVYVAIVKQQADDPTVDVQAKAYFKKMEDGEPEAIALWKRFRDLSIVQYSVMYERLNVNFDVYSGESQVSNETQEAALKKLQDMQVVTPGYKVIHENGKPLPETGLEPRDGSLRVDFKKLGFPALNHCLVQKSDGTKLYMTRDIGAAIDRYEKYKFDKMIYVIASEQYEHVHQFFKILELMGNKWADKLQYVTFGMVMGMSTRKGTVQFLEDILDEAQQRMNSKMSENEEKYKEMIDPMHTADIIGMAAIKIQDMSGKRRNNYTYNADKMMAQEGDTGPYLQYQCARLHSIQRKCAPELVLRDDISTINTDILSENEQARAVVLLLAKFPSVVKTALKTEEPSAIVTYCFKLTRAISAAYENVIVKGSGEEDGQAKLLFYSAAKDVLESAMKLLTLTPLTRM